MTRGERAGTGGNVGVMTLLTGDVERRGGLVGQVVPSGHTSE